jgi:hypothetical protein
LAKSYCLLPQWYDHPIFAQRNLEISAAGEADETVGDGAGGGFGECNIVLKFAGSAGVLDINCLGPEDSYGESGIYGRVLTRDASEELRRAFHNPSSGKM